MTDKELIRQMVEIIDYVNIVKCLNRDDLEVLRAVTQRLAEITNERSDAIDREGGEGAVQA